MNRENKTGAEAMQRPTTVSFQTAKDRLITVKDTINTTTTTADEAADMLNQTYARRRHLLSSIGRQQVCLNLP